MKRFIGFLTILLLAACARGPAPTDQPNLDTQAILTVNTFADEAGSGPSCSLREAIISANNNANTGGCVAGGAYNTTTADVINLSCRNLYTHSGFYPRSC